jgi:hypothetical protein
MDRVLQNKSNSCGRSARILRLSCSDPQSPEFRHEIVEAEAFVRLDFPQSGRVRPADVERPNGLGLQARGVVQLVMRPQDDARAPGVIASTPLHIMVAGVLKEDVQLRPGVGEIDLMARR